MGETTEIQIEPAKPFKWPKGLCLSATSNVTILLPGGLIQNDEKIGSVIEVPDDADIGFRDATGTDEPFESLIVKLKPGMSIRLHRSTQAIVLHDSPLAAIFNIEKSVCP